MKKSFALIWMTALLPLIALAHEGHGTTDGFTIIHYFTEPLHALVAIMVTVIAVYLFVRWNKRARE